MASIAIGSGLGISIASAGDVKVAAEWSRGVPGYGTYLWVGDNGRLQPGSIVDPGYFTVHGLTRQQALDGNYNGVPQVELRIHLAAVAHGIVICTDGTMLVTTSEALGETAPPEGIPGDQNYHESVLVIDADKIQPAATPQVINITADDYVRVRCGELGGDVFSGRVVTHYGMRDVNQMHDGSILLSRGVCFTRMPLTQLRTKTALTSAPVQYTTGAQGEFGGWGQSVDPENPEHVWSLGTAPPLPAALMQFDLTNPPGVNTIARLGRGANYDPNNWGGGGHGFDSAKNLWVARGGVPDIACFTRAQLNTLNSGNPPINLVPARTITSSKFSALNLANESLWALTIRDDRIWITTYYYGAAPRSAARTWVFDAAALAGGEHEPVIELGGMPTRAMQLVFAPGL